MTYDDSFESDVCSLAHLKVFANECCSCERTKPHLSRDCQFH